MSTLNYRQLEDLLIDLQIGRAYRVAQNQGLEARVICEDGVHYIITHDCHPNRANFTVEKGRVTKVTWG